MMVLRCRKTGLEMIQGPPGPPRPRECTTPTSINRREAHNRYYMLLALNGAYQFFLSSSPEHERDLERGIPDKSPIRDNGLNALNDSNEAEAGEGANDRDGNDHMEEVDDADEDDNEIINDVERDSEEYPEAGPKHRHRRMPPRFRKLTPAKSVLSNKRPSTLWQRIKDYLSTDTTSEEIEAFVPRYRYLPILSGVVIPLSILLQIPGLTEDWYIRTLNNEVVEHRPNTTIVDVGLAFSMASAVLANSCLIARFLEKNVKMMTILCVVFLTIHDIINIIAVTDFGVEHRFSDGFTYGQAYWITVCSTSVSIFVNVTLIVDLIRTPDFDKSGSGLTRKQRTLVISVMVLLAYIALGALVQTFLNELSFINALYFTVCTIETIGFGDTLPTTVGSKIFTCFYAVFGIVSLALTVAITRETVLEGIEVGYRKRVQAVKHRRKQMVYERRVYGRWQAAIEWRLNKKGKSIWVCDRKDHIHSKVVLKLKTLWDNFKRNHPGIFLRSGSSEWYNYPRPHGMHLNLEGLSFPELEAAAMEAGVPLNSLLPPDFRPETSPLHDTSGPSSLPFPPLPQETSDLPLTYARIGRMVAMLGRFALAVQASPLVPASKRPSLPLHPPIRIERTYSVRSVAEQYENMRASMEEEETRAFRARLIIVWVIFFIFWTVGSGIFVATEDWPYGTAFYFCFIAFTTIGYGDFSPVTPAGRSIFVVWALLGVGTMTILISIVSEAYSSKYKRALHDGTVTTVIKRYQERAKLGESKPHPPDQAPDTSKTPVSSPVTKNQPDTAITLVGNGSSPALPQKSQSVDDINQKVQNHLEALPNEVLKQATRFQENVRYLTSDHPGAEMEARKHVPDGLKQLITDIAGVEQLAERIRDEILKDANARHTLLAISIEHAIGNLVNVAEQAIWAIEERDRLINPDPDNREEAGGSGLGASPVSQSPEASKADLTTP